MSFSERMGLRSARTVLQIDSMDAHLRTALFNYLVNAMNARWQTPQGTIGVGCAMARAIWTEFWRQRSDHFFNSRIPFGNHLHEYFDESEWFEIYDLIEFCVAHNASLFNVDVLNDTLQRDMSGYRMRENIIVPITDDIELSALDEALALDDRFRGARQHLSESLAKLSARPTPDLRNSIKEAISSVESAARVVTGHHKATLGEALKVLEKSGHVHAALKEAWSKMYGYTSDQGGLRHAMLDEPEIDFAIAKYMLVVCAGFVNLLATRT
jgi:hypothetical protein